MQPPQISTQIANIFVGKFRLPDTPQRNRLLRIDYQKAAGGDFLGIYICDFNVGPPQVLLLILIGVTAIPQIDCLTLPHSRRESCC